MDRVAKAAYDNDRTYEGCTRYVLHALQTHLHLTDNGKFKGAFKASTALAASIARMSEVCGALIGGVMAIGLTFGSETLDDVEGYRRAMEASYELYTD